MPKPSLWGDIADTLTAEVGRGGYGPGDKLPSEAELSLRFGVNRHTVRRALAHLAGQGLLHARRGAGVFVAARPTEYPLGQRVRFAQAVQAGGQSPSRRFLRRETRSAAQEEARLLGLTDGAQVHVVEGISLADGLPLAAFQSVFPALRFAGLLHRLDSTLSITQALRDEGLADYTRASTRIVADRAGAALAGLLHLPEGAPVLRTKAVNVDAVGQPVEFGTTWFAGDRVTLTVGPDACEK